MFAANSNKTTNQGAYLYHVVLLDCLDKKLLYLARLSIPVRCNNKIVSFIDLNSKF